MRRRAEAALTVLLTIIVVAASGAVWLVSTRPIHEDAAPVPSTVAAAPPDRYVGSVEESRALARALIAGDNLPAQR